VQLRSLIHSDAVNKLTTRRGCPASPGVTSAGRDADTIVLRSGRCPCFRVQCGQDGQARLLTDTQMLLIAVLKLKPCDTQ
jgi:hypothetical protein